MSNRLKSFALASLVFSLTCGVGLAASDVVVKHTLAQTAASSDGKAEADKLFQDGVQQFRRGEYPKALQTYQRVLEIRRKLGDKVGEAATLNNLGEIYNGLNQPTQALEVLQPALNLYKVIGDKAAIGEVLDNIGTSYRLKSDTTKALESYQQALTIRREVKDREGEGKTLSNIGFAYSNQEQYPKALETLQQALAIHKEVKDKYREGYTLIRIGIVYGNLWEYKREFEFYQQSLILNRELGNKDGELRSLLNTGWHYNSQQDYVRAVDFWQQSLVIVREIKNKSLEASTLENIGDAYSSRKEYGKSIEFYQQALPITKELPNNKLQEANIIAGIGDAYKNQEKYETALKYYQQALTIAKEAQYKSREAAILHMMGNIYSSQKQYNQAIKFYEQALPVAREAKDKSREANILAAIADAYKLQNKYDQAIKFYEQALPIAREAQENLLEASIFNVLGSYYFDTKAYDLALKSYQQALPLVRKVNNRPIQINIITQIMRTNYLLANQVASKKDYADAIKQAQQAINLSPEGLTLAREEKDSKAEKEILTIQSQTYSFIGNVYIDLGDLEKAREFAEEGLKTARQAQNLQAEDFALSILAGISDLRGNYPNKLEFIQQKLENSRKLNNSVSEVSALLEIAGIYIILGDYPKGIEFSQQAFTKIETVDITKLPEKNQAHAWFTRSFTYWNLSQIYISVGEYDKALEFAQRRFDFVSNSKQPELKADALIGLGNVYAARQEFETAIKLTQQALDIGKQIKNPRVEAEALKNIAKFYTASGDYNKATEFANLLLNIAESNKNINLKLDYITILNDIYIAQGNYQKTLDILKQGLTISRQEKNPIKEYFSLIYIAKFYAELGDYKQGIEFSQQAFATAQRAKNPQLEGISLFLLSWISFLKGEPQETIKFTQQGLAISQKSKMIWLEMLGNAGLSIGHGELNNDQEAVKAAQALLTIARKSQSPTAEKTALTILGNIHRKFGRKQEAIQTYNQALGIKVQGKAVGADSAIYAGLGRTYADLNQPQLAISYYKEAINRIEEVRSGIKLLTPELQASFLQSTVDFGKVKTSDIYRQLADLLSYQGRNAEAQQILELLALQNINDFTRQTRGNTKVTDVELNNAEKQIVNKHGTLIAFGKQLAECDNKCSQLSSLKNQYRQLTEEFNQLVKNIQNSEVDKSSINKVYDRTSDLIAGASKIVDEQEDTVLIYPLVLKDKIRILWASKGGVFGSKVCKMGEDELNTDVTNFRKLLQNPYSDIKQVKATGKKLYDCLIQPVEAELKANKIKHLVFVPDLATNYIPMGALFDGEKYLLESYTITSVLNVGLTNFEETLPSEVKKTQVLGLGLSKEMTTRDGVFPALKNVIRELDSIIKSKPNDTKGIYPGDKFVDQDFNIDALENNLQGRNILHIATHALFKPKDPTKSYILLGTGTEYPIDQIQFLNNLRGVHLVVLSACETALGGLDQNGMEIKGISSFFLKDKAKAVMASLWKVDDPSTYQLMQLFYQNLASKMAKSEALRQAQLSLLKGNNSTSRNPKERSIRVNIPPGTSSRNEEAQSGYSHPYYWAPFILTGNGL